MTERNPGYVRAIYCKAKRCPHWAMGNYCGYEGRVIISSWGQCSEFMANYEEIENLFAKCLDKQGVITLE